MNGFPQQLIIDLSAEDARRFFMKKESFCNISLPQYFDFQKLLDAISAEINNNSRKFTTIYDKKPHWESDVNYTFFQNKDGRFSWRPLQLINPVIYAYLVNEITESENWELIVNRFKEFDANPQIVCYSLPRVNNSLKTDTTDTILDWWDNIEQQSIRLAMDYNYLMITDITDCYSSIYTHSITWAMCGIDKAKERTQNKKVILSEADEKRYELGDAIDDKLRAMSFNQTNGIPQGSILMDFIAEIILGYVDLELSERLNNESTIKKYRILRYRDDYRIFGSTQEDVIKIAKILTEELARLNFKLNAKKTILTQDLVCDAIKADKLYYITRDYRRLEEPDNHYSLQKHILRINQLAQKHPNSGSLQKAMDIFFKRICEWKDLDLFKEAGSSETLISIATNIAYNNPKVYKQYVGIVGKILSYEADVKEKNKIINKILSKFKQLPNVGYLELWLQRLTIKDDRTKECSEDLCKYAAGGKTSIWNVGWLKTELKDIFTSVSFVDEGAISKLPDAIEYEEFESFNKY